MSPARTNRFSIVTVTSPNNNHARLLSKKILKNKLCACVQLVPKVESHYWWKGKLSESTETWMIIKTHATKIKKLESMIRKNHPYDVPEILEIKISNGNSDYLKWIQQSLGLFKK